MSLASSSHYLVSVFRPSIFPSFLPFTVLGLVRYSLFDHLFLADRDETGSGFEKMSVSSLAPSLTLFPHDHLTRTEQGGT